MSISELMEMAFKKAVWKVLPGILLVLIFSSCSPAIFAGKMDKRDKTKEKVLKKPMTPKQESLPLVAGPSIHPETLALLKRAYQLKKEGRLADAQKLARKAKVYTPIMELPEWAKPGFQGDPFLESPSQRDVLLREARRELGSRLKPGLEAALAQNPGDTSLRLLLLELAKKEGNSPEARYHKNVLDGAPETGASDLKSRDSWNKALAGIFLLIIMGQSTRLYRMMRENE